MAVIDMTGQRFGKLVVLSQAGSSKHGRTWLCLCDCGKHRTVRGDKLRGGLAKSCGCLRAGLTKQTSPKKQTGQKKRTRPSQARIRTPENGCARRQFGHGMTSTPTYRSWVSMLDRCRVHPRYAGRGITVCDRWKTFTNFLADMGERPAGTSIDRYPDQNGNYEPGNCRWATPTEQVHNSRAVRLEEHEPEQIRWLASLGYSQAEIARFFGVAPGTIRRVLTGEAWAVSSLPPARLIERRGEP